MHEVCDRPAPEVYQPRVSPWGHAWRIALMVALSAMAWVPIVDDQSQLQRVLDVALGVLAYVLVCWRRRWPLPVAIAVSLFAGASAIASGPAVLAAASVATRRRWREIAAVAVVGLAAAEFFVVWQPGDNPEPFWLVASINAVVTAAVMGWGMYIGSRRELIWTLRNRAESAEAEQELRVVQARANERSRIAREMHDVLAHRISQISMHAGALAFRQDLSPEEVRASAGVIREKSHEALTDLRGVLGVLRDADGELTLAPQPTYADLGALVAEARETGLGVELHDDVSNPGEVPLAAGRTVYRIVQEGITNARKHAPGTVLTVELSGSPEEGLRVVLRNPLGFGSSMPGSGLGLVGLSERAELRGGRLDAHREGTSFVLQGWIPWAV